MQFESVSDFLAMGGYAFYVWLAFGVSAAAMIAIVVDSIVKRNAIFKSVARQSARQQRVQAAKEVTERL
ncbi:MULTISPECIES: heme exporter protein CcmD [unclassified Agarivorans]|uniref:heme exporter protein CcmD n=1 Tax=unclassified Agarivorans TaxID=2636026 RepID=UPI0026E1DE7F|nr:MULTISPECIES: heme exporter protein CcmD [unclassified Agarivorans]MDO6686238.1 heme exporter protein CcmD [Agarivorans sp. 3_MG-2023]MDO6716313.1 heme exporter protein CcmD [Agarivorans sp. 2_MG-2023]MDO6764771.1 heme exporter protein CcmD [Agarivorans sp. 1_MG-2023]